MGGSLHPRLGGNESQGGGSLHPRLGRARSLHPRSQQFEDAAAQERENERRAGELARTPADETLAARAGRMGRPMVDLLEAPEPSTVRGQFGQPIPSLAETRPRAARATIGPRRDLTQEFLEAPSPSGIPDAMTGLRQVVGAVRKAATAPGALFGPEERLPERMHPAQIAVAAQEAVRADAPRVAGRITPAEFAERFGASPALRLPPPTYEAEFKRIAQEESERTAPLLLGQRSALRLEELVDVQKHPRLYGAMRAASGFTTPESAALIGGTAGLPGAAARIVSGKFTWDMLRGVDAQNQVFQESINRAEKLANEGAPREEIDAAIRDAEVAFGEALVTGPMAGVLAKHTLHPRAAAAEQRKPIPAEARGPVARPETRVPSEPAPASRPAEPRVAARAAAERVPVEAPARASVTAQPAPRTEAQPAEGATVQSLHPRLGQRREPTDIQHHRVIGRLKEMERSGEIVPMSKATPEELAGLARNREVSTEVRQAAQERLDSRALVEFPKAPEGSIRTEALDRIAFNQTGKAYADLEAPLQRTVRDFYDRRVKAGMEPAAEPSRALVPEPREGPMRTIQVGREEFAEMLGFGKEPAQVTAVRLRESIENLKEAVREQESESARSEARGDYGMADEARFEAESFRREVRELERDLDFLEGREPKRPALPGDTGTLYSNPIFNPAVVRSIDRLLSEKITQPIARKVQAAVGRLPEGMQKLFRSHFGRFPEVRKIYEEARLEIAAARNEGEALSRMWLRTKPTPEETIAFERVVRGFPQDLGPQRMRPAQRAVVERVRLATQKLTAERQALGLNVREEWLQGPKSWYPNFFRQHLGQYMAGKLLGRAKMTPGKAATGSLHQRLSDRFWFADRTGKPVESAEGQVAAFKTREAAETFQRNKGGKGWKIVEPMTFDQLIGHGLITDPNLNLRQGFTLQGTLLGKSRFLARLAEMPNVVKATRQDGYIALDEIGFAVPKILADKNASIAKLRDGYVYEPLAKELNALYGRRGPFSTAFRVAEGSLRKWATVRNPFRHPRQIFENELTLAMTDMAAFIDKPAQAKAFLNYVRGNLGDPNVPYWKEFINSRIGHTDMVSGEFETMWRGLARQSLEPNAPLSLTERLAIWGETNPVAKKILAADNLAHRLYRMEDASYKYYRFSRLREQGMEHEAAVKNVKDRAFDYFDVPVIVGAVNRVIPFMPNVVFQYSRIFANMLRDEPVSMMLRLGLLSGAAVWLRDEMQERSGLTDKDIAAMDKALAPSGTTWCCRGPTTKGAT